jgi:hypothetical protein
LVVADQDCTHRSIRAGWQAFGKDYSSVFSLLGAAQFMCAIRPGNINLLLRVATPGVVVPSRAPTLMLWQKTFALMTAEALDHHDFSYPWKPLATCFVGRAVLKRPRVLLESRFGLGWRVVFTSALAKANHPSTDAPLSPHFPENRRHRSGARPRRLFRVPGPRTINATNN